ncbi:MAG: helix-turn-helix domain-containing protein [Pseudonocardiaceae bacterium]
MAQIATEMARRFGLRPRVAWRHALGWPQRKLAQRYNTLHPGARLSDNRVSEFEAWPHGGSPPSPRYLAQLAVTYGHGCTPAQLVDADDLEHLSPAECSLLTTGHSPAAVATRAADSLPYAPVCEPADPGPAVQRAEGDTGGIWGSRRLVRCDARGAPVREEVIVAAEESAQFWRWSAATNVDDDVLEQMTVDVAELARREQIDPPASVFASVLGARDDVFALIAGRQQPRHTTDLYKIAGQLCGLLSIATFDLGHPHAANTHARTALHCAEVSGHTPLRVFVRYVQSNIAYWAGRYDEAAQLVESALPDATSGTAVLRLASQQARIHAARRQPGEVSQALALAATAPTERTPDEPGTFGFDTGTAALCASDAHSAFDETEYLNAAVDWARIALDEFTTASHPKAMYLAAARFNLARAHLARGELDAVAEHLAPVLSSTNAEYRTVPIIGRAHSLHTLLSQRTDLASSTLITLSDDLAEFITHPAPPRHHQDWNQVPPPDSSRTGQRHKRIDRARSRSVNPHPLTEVTENGDLAMLTWKLTCAQDGHRTLG